MAATPALLLSPSMTPDDTRPKSFQQDRRLQTHRLPKFESHMRSTKTSLDECQGDGLHGPSKPVDDLRLVSIETEEPCDPSVVAEEIIELSESQISLVHGSVETPGASIIYYYETYRPGQISRMKNASNDCGLNPDT